MRIDKLVVIRIVLLIVALINQFLAIFSFSPLPIADDELSLLVGTIFTIIIAIWTAWKDNPVTQKAISEKQLIKEMER